MLTILTDNILELFGNTPLLHLKSQKIFVKAEFFSAGGGIKAPDPSIK
ncbi:MAG: hypothetical protein WAV28_15850 [Sedimentisphaerales bacterium]